VENGERKVRIPKQKRGLKTKEQIIEAGLKFFSDKGYYKTNSKEIAAEAGVAIGSFYAYFKDKKTLFIEIMAKYFKMVADTLRNSGANNTFDINNKQMFIHTLVRNILSAHEISPGFHREISIVMNTDSDVDRIVSEHEDRILENTLKTLKQYKDHIRVNDIEAAAVIVHRGIEEIVHTIKYAKLKTNENRLVNELVDMISRYLFNE
jgi:AcrR family transcriptional regulator